MMWPARQVRCSSVRSRHAKPPITNMCIDNNDCEEHRNSFCSGIQSQHFRVSGTSCTPYFKHQRLAQR